MVWRVEKLVMDVPKITFEEVPASARTERDRLADEQFHRNTKWLAAHWADVLPQAHGRFIAVSGQEAFIADTIEEALARAKAAHPDDEGIVSQYVLPPGGPRIYGNRWGMDSL
jgi:hypothetical protein